MNQWPHSPSHILNKAGTYMVTAATYKKLPLFNTKNKIELLHDNILEKAEAFDWQLQAWAVFPNHYHFIAVSPQNSETLKRLIKGIHGSTATTINQLDSTPGRKVWFQYWDSQITFEKSYFPRLNYVINNAVHHGIVKDARRYQWCSASWFSKTAGKSFQETVASFKTERLRIPDDF